MIGARQDLRDEEKLEGRRHGEALLRAMLDTRAAPEIDGGKTDASMEVGFEVGKLHVRQCIRRRHCPDQSGAGTCQKSPSPPRTRVMPIPPSPAPLVPDRARRNP